MPKSRTRQQLNAYLLKLGIPHTKVGEVYIQDIQHDSWCKLGWPTATLQTKCRCAPTVTLKRMGDHGEILETIPLLEDGRPVVYES